MTQPSSKKKGGLGRGLASLIPTGPADGGPRLGDAATPPALHKRANRRGFRCWIRSLLHDMGDLSNGL